MSLVAASAALMLVSGRAAAVQLPNGPTELDAEGLKDLARTSPDELHDAGGSGRAEVGRPFRLTLLFIDARVETRAAAATWSYDPRAEALTLSFRPVGAAELAGVELEHIARPGRRLNLAPAGSPPRFVQALRARKLDADFVQAPPTGSQDTSTFAFTLHQVTPDQALALARSGQVDLTGRVATFGDAGPSRCSIQAIRTEVPEPTLTNLVTCAVALRLEAVTFILPGRGEVKAWKAEAPALVAVVPLAPPREPRPPPPSTQDAQSGEDGAAPRDDGAHPPPLVDERPAPSAPAWISSPEPELVERFYPLAAYAKGIGGSVTLDCLELENGRVTDCEVVEETPLGYGFGRAALSLSRAFLFTSSLVDGRPSKARILVPYEFSVTDDGADPMTASSSAGAQEAAPQSVKPTSASSAPRGPVRPDPR